MPALSDLPKIFQDADYQHAVLDRLAAITPKDRNVDLRAAEEVTSDPTPANLLARVFYMGRPAPRGALEAVLTAPLCQLLLEEGLLRDAGEGTLQAECAVVPARDFWCLRDFEPWATGRHVAEDHVLGVGIASALLADCTVRRTGERVLDMGTGQGFQAATAARHAARVIGTDINARALRLAAWAMRLNAVSNVELRQGDFFAPVEGDKGTFDLLVSNPPFVIAPPHDIAAYGGRWIGDSFVEKLVTEAPAFLAEGGWATVLGNWHHPTPEDWTTRPLTWLTGRGTDAWLVKLSTENPHTYAATWLRNWLRETQASQTDAAINEAQERLRQWMAYFESIHIGAISMGVFFLRKRTPRAGQPPNWVRADALPMESRNGATGPQVQRLFESETRLRAMADESAVLDLRLTAVAASELEQHLRPAGGQWQPVETVLRQIEGFSFPIALGPVPATILARMDGSRPARAIIHDLAKEMRADPAVACAQSAPFLAKMLRMTHLEVVE